MSSLSFFFFFTHTLHFIYVYLKFRSKRLPTYKKHNFVPFKQVFFGQDIIKEACNGSVQSIITQIFVILIYASAKMIINDCCIQQKYEQQQQRLVQKKFFTSLRCNFWRLFIVDTTCSNVTHILKFYKKNQMKNSFPVLLSGSEKPHTNYFTFQVTSISSWLYINFIFHC